MLEQPRKMKIKASAKAFDILTKNLYKDPLVSTMRELIVNAADASKNSGKLPVLTIKKTVSNKKDLLNGTDNIKENQMGYISVRDYGKGLSESEMYDLYSTLFESSKEKDSEQTGMFGIGSKSPFSLNSEFFVTSIQQGQYKKYKCYYSDKDDVPHIAKINEGPADSEDGLLVEVENTKVEVVRYSWRGTSASTILATLKMQLLNIPFKIKMENEEYINIEDNIKNRIFYRNKNDYICRIPNRIRNISSNLSPHINTKVAYVNVDSIMYKIDLSETIGKYIYDKVIELQETDNTLGKEEIEKIASNYRSKFITIFSNKYVPVVKYTKHDNIVDPSRENLMLDETLLQDILEKTIKLWEDFCDHIEKQLSHSNSRKHAILDVYDVFGIYFNDESNKYHDIDIRNSLPFNHMYKYINPDKNKNLAEILEIFYNIHYTRNVYTLFRHQDANNALRYYEKHRFYQIYIGISRDGGVDEFDNGCMDSTSTSKNNLPELSRYILQRLKENENSNRYYLIKKNNTTLTKRKLYEYFWRKIYTVPPLDQERVQHDVNLIVIDVADSDNIDHEEYKKSFEEYFCIDSSNVVLYSEVESLYKDLVKRGEIKIDKKPKTVKIYQHLQIVTDGDGGYYYAEMVRQKKPESLLEAELEEKFEELETENEDVLLLPIETSNKDRKLKNTVHIGQLWDGKTQLNIEISYFKSFMDNYLRYVKIHNVAFPKKKIKLPKNIFILSKQTVKKFKQENEYDLIHNINVVMKKSVLEGLYGKPRGYYDLDSVSPFEDISVIVESNSYYDRDLRVNVIKDEDEEHFYVDIHKTSSLSSLLYKLALRDPYDLEDHMLEHIIITTSHALEISEKKFAKKIAKNRDIMSYLKKKIRISVYLKYEKLIRDFVGTICDFANIPNRPHVDGETLNSSNILSPNYNSTLLPQKGAGKEGRSIMAKYEDEYLFGFAETTTSVLKYFHKFDKNLKDYKESNNDSESVDAFIEATKNTEKLKTEFEENILSVLSDTFNIYTKMLKKHVTNDFYQLLFDNDVKEITYEEFRHTVVDGFDPKTESES